MTASETRTLATDARGIQTNLVYGPVNGISSLYVTEVDQAYTRPEQRRTSLEYDFWVGQVTLATDLDNAVSTRTAIWIIHEMPTWPTRSR